MKFQNCGCRSVLNLTDLTKFFTGNIQIERGGDSTKAEGSVVGRGGEKGKSGEVRGGGKGGARMRVCGDGGSCIYPFIKLLPSDGELKLSCPPVEKVIG